MHLSNYCKVYPSPTNSKKLILFSTKNAAIAELPVSLLRKIQKGSPIPEADEKLLRRMGFLVKNPDRERQSMARYIDDLNRVSGFFSIKVVMGLDCNLACRYCFEGNRKGKFLMTKETADELVGFIVSKIPLYPPLPKGGNKGGNNRKIDHPLPGPLPSRERDENTSPSFPSRLLLAKQTGSSGEGFKSSPPLRGGDKGEGGGRRQAIDEIYLTFYGGEPLLSKKLIAYIAEKVRAIAEQGKIFFSFSLQTNGTLLTRKIVEELKPLGLVEAFITLDGPADIHDSQRPYKSGRGSFGQILKNIQDVCDLIDIRLSGNFTKRNFRRFTGLLDYLAENDLGPDRLPPVQFFPVVAERKDVLPDFSDGCGTINEPWLMKAGLYLREEILKRGYRMEPVSPVVCMMEHRNNILVNYDGTIYKCPGLIGRQEYASGHIRTGISDYSGSHNLDNWKNDECLACTYLPLCFGGCRYMKYVREGSMKGIDCKKPYFDKVLGELISQDIRYGIVRQ